MPIVRILESVINAITTPVRQLAVWFLNCLPTFRYLRNRSLPFQWALLSFFAMLLTGMGLIAFRFFLPGASSQDPAGDSWLRNVAAPLVCLVIVPPLVYQFVKILLTEEMSPFPEIQKIWTDGVLRAKEKGFDLVGDQIPIYLVIGTEGGHTNSMIVESLGGAVLVQEPSSGDSPITFCLVETNSGVAAWVMTQGCSCISSLQHAVHRNSTIKQIATRSNFASPQRDYGGVSIALQEELEEERDERTNRNAGFTDRKRSDEPSGTIMFGYDEPSHGSVRATAEVNGKIAENEVNTIAIETPPRLAYLCELIQKTFGDFPEIDCILTMLPVHLIDSMPEKLAQLASCDMDCLQQNLRIRVPNVLCITSMEKCPGFLEFVSRQIAKSGNDPSLLTRMRIGYGAESVWMLPTQERVSAIVRNSLNTMLDMSQQFFYRDGNVRKIDKDVNKELFRLVSKLRSDFSTKLDRVAKNFGCSGENLAISNEPFPIAGCYFAATGQRKIDQRFLPAVLLKVMETSGGFRWTDAETQKDRRRHSLANLLTLLCIIFLAVIGALLWMQARQPAKTSLSRPFPYLHVSSIDFLINQDAHTAELFDQFSAPFGTQDAR